MNPAEALSLWREYLSATEVSESYAERVLEKHHKALSGTETDHLIDYKQAINYVGLLQRQKGTTCDST